MARGGRLPRAAGRPPRFLRTGHRRATSLNEAHLQAARRDAGHTLGREAEGVLQSLLFHRASRGLRAQRATFRVLAEGDPDVDAALASAVGCPPPPRSLTPPRPPLSDQRGRAARLRRCPDCPMPAVRPAAAALLLCCLHDSVAWLASGASRPPWRARGRFARFPRRVRLPPKLPAASGRCQAAVTARTAGTGCHVEVAGSVVRAASDPAAIGWH